MTEEIDVSRDIYRDCADIIEKNRYWIAEEAVGRMKEKYPAFVIPGDTGTSTQGTDKCIRDTHSFIIPAIVNDLKLGGNFNTIVAGRGYLEGSGALSTLTVNFYSQSTPGVKLPNFRLTLLPRMKMI